QAVTKKAPIAIFELSEQSTLNNILEITFIVEAKNQKATVPKIALETANMIIDTVTRNIFISDNKGYKIEKTEFTLVTSKNGKNKNKSRRGDLVIKAKTHRVKSEGPEDQSQELAILKKIKCIQNMKKYIF
ncbi:28367_t:CDS:2, partial [Dentiscutata erythropus]